MSNLIFSCVKDRTDKFREGNRSQVNGEQNGSFSSFFHCRNTPVLLESIMFCLLTCNQFTAGNEPPEIRRQGKGFQT